MYDCCLKHQTINPSWLHFTEHIPYQDLSVEDYETMTARISIDSGASLQDRATLLQIPIHPSKLSRIESMDNKNLPLNAVIITFSDDSKRVPPSLYNCLVEKRQLEPQQTLSRDIEFGRFKDNAFHALDAVSPGRMRTSLLETDDPSLASPIRNHAVPSAYDDIPFIGNEPEAATQYQSVHLVDPYVGDEVGNDAHDLLQEQRCLEELIELESTSLERDLAILKQEGEDNIRISKHVETTRTQIEEVLTETEVLGRESQKNEFLLDAQRIRLFRELRLVYPITLIASEQRYKIRDLEISNEIFVGPVADEETNAALGCLCHLLSMMGKYLSIQYRYRIYYHSSRSAIQDDRAVVFPLFIGRTIEREQFEHGLRLLGSNVDCLIKVHGIRVSPRLHILGKVKRIYESVIDGF